MSALFVEAAPRVWRDDGLACLAITSGRIETTYCLTPATARKLARRVERVIAEFATKR